MGSRALTNLYTWRWEEARRVHEETVRTKPSGPNAFRGYSWFTSFTGDHKTAEQMARRHLQPEAKIALRTAEALLPENTGARGLRASELIWAYGAAGARDDALRLHAWLEQWSKDFEVGAGDWALASIGVGDYEAARLWLERAVVHVEAHEPEVGFYQLMTIKANPFSDPVLERPAFRELRAQLDGFE